MPLLLPLLLSLLTLLSACPATAGSGERRAFDTDSPPQLLAVGKLKVPGHRFEAGSKRHLEEDCSASLIASGIILTAWHCLEHYRDLSREISFTLPHLPSLSALTAFPIADGGGMDADWALLRLSRPLPGIRPLAVSSRPPGPASPALTLAGYSGDPGLGNAGAHLTWESGCRITGAGDGRVVTDCAVFKGASGGPVLADGKIVGIISAGDSVSVTWFVPSRAFISAVRLHAY